MCGTELKSHLDVVKLHYKYHVGTRDHSCAACGSSFMDSNTLRDHERLHLKTIALNAIGANINIDKKSQLTACEHCGKEIVKKNLKAHVKSVHMGIKPDQSKKKKRQFTCLVCDHKTKSSWPQLAQHFEQHKELTLENLTCTGFKEQCAKQFASLIDLHKHFYTVHWDGILCTLCNVVIITRGYYTDHLASHSSLKVGPISRI